MPRQKPPDAPDKTKKQDIVRVDQARSPKRTTSKKSPKRASAKGADVVAVATSPNRSMEDSAMDPKMTMQVPEAVREVAEKAVEQTEKAFDVFLSAANKSVAMMPSPATDISKKTLALTEQNMKSAFEYARKLLHAKDIQEVLQIQGDFFKSQLAAAQEQMKQMGTGAVSAAKELDQDINKS
jgi:phasin